MGSGPHEIEDEWDNTAWEEEEEEVISPSEFVPLSIGPSGPSTATSSAARDPATRLQSDDIIIPSTREQTASQVSASSTANPQGKSQGAAASNQKPPPKLPNKFFFAILVMVVTGYMILHDAYGYLEMGDEDLYLTISQNAKRPKKPGADRAESTNQQQFGVVSVKSNFETGSIDELEKNKAKFLPRGENDGDSDGESSVLENVQEEDEKPNEIHDIKAATEDNQPALNEKLSQISDKKLPEKKEQVEEEKREQEESGEEEKVSKEEHRCVKERK